MSYQFHEDVSVADVAFSAEASSLAQLCEEAAKATFEVMVKLDDVESRVTKTIELKADTAEKLLFAWIEELIYLKDAEELLFSKFAVQVKEGKAFTLTAEVVGDKIDPKRQTTNVDVKAITYHEFRVEETEEGWRAFVILDI